MDRSGAGLGGADQTRNPSQCAAGLITAMLLAGVMVLAGSDGSAEKTVRILPSGTGALSVDCFALEANMAGQILAATRAKKGSLFFHELDLAPGTLLQVSVRTPDEPSKSRSFLYLYKGTEAVPLAFDWDHWDNVCGLLNRKAVYLDLTDEKALLWLLGQSDSALADVGVIEVGSGHMEADLQVLSRFAGSGVVVVLHDELLAPGAPAPAAAASQPTSRPAEELRADCLRALVAVQPRGLLAKGPVEGLDAILPELTHLTHLLVREVSVAALEKLKNLRYLEVAYVQSGATTRPLAESPDFMSALAKLPHLRSLTLTGQEKHADSPGAMCPPGLGKLKSLRNLTLVNLELPELSPLAALTNLRSLTMVDPGPVTDLSPLARLQELRALVIVPLPAEA